MSVPTIGPRLVTGEVRLLLVLWTRERMLPVCAGACAVYLMACGGYGIEA